MAEITVLIDGQDTFEAIRDKIAAILFTEQEEQVALATAAGKEDPTQWALRVYAERSTPWDDYNATDLIVNVWFDNATPVGNASNTVKSQTMRGTFNIDVIGFGASTATQSGHSPGDEVAAMNAQRGLRLVRNIIMASQYTYLGMRGIVGQRMPEGVNVYQPQQNNKPTVHTVGARLSLSVTYSEYAPQYEPATLQELGVTLERAEDGEILAVLEYEYPL